MPELKIAQRIANFLGSYRLPRFHCPRVLTSGIMDALFRPSFCKEPLNLMDSPLQHQPWVFEEQIYIYVRLSKSR
jgi:hypothetical protein